VRQTQLIGVLLLSSSMIITCVAVNIIAFAVTYINLPASQAF